MNPYRIIQAGFPVIALGSFCWFVGGSKLLLVMVCVIAFIVLVAAGIAWLETKGEEWDRTHL